MLKKIIFNLPLGGLQQQQIPIAAAADTLAAAAASNRKATTAISIQYVLWSFFSECNTDCLQRKLEL
jgi:hypothetical protein